MSQPFANQPPTTPADGPTPPGGYAQPAYGQPYAPPPQKSKWWLWLLGGCGCSAVLLVLCCGGVSYWGFSKGMSVVGDQLRPEVADNADVKENIGEIDSLTMNIMATSKEKQERKDNTNWIVFDVTGDKGDGQFIVEMPPGGRDGKPFGKIELRLEDGKVIPIK